MPKTVIHATSVHSCFDVRIFEKMCRTLGARGYKTHLVAPCDTAECLNLTELRNGVQIHKVGMPINRISRFLHTTPLVLRRAAEINGDIFHFHDPEFLPYLYQFQRRVKRPVVYDAHEDLRNHILLKQYLPEIARRSLAHICGWVEDIVVKNIAGVVSAHPSISARFQKHSKHVLIRNYPVLCEFALPEAGKYLRHPRFVYIGGLSKLRGAREMVTALEAVNENVSLILGGKWDSTQEEAVCRAMPGWSRVIDAGFLNREEVVNLLHGSAAGIVVLHPTKSYSRSLPVKLLEYMAAGLPVIASCSQEWSEIIKEGKCGILVNPMAPEEIAKAMNWIIGNPDESEEMGRRGRQLVERHYNWETECEKLVQFYEELLRDTSTEDD